MNTDATRRHVHALVDQLPPQQLSALEGLLTAVLETKAPGEVLPEDAEAVFRSEAWFEGRGGKGIPMEEVLAGFGLTEKDFPRDENGA